MEYAFNENWSSKLEYNYMDFGSYNVAFSDGAETEDLTFDQQVQTIKLGVNYRF